MSDQVEPIKTRTARIWLGEDGIIRNIIMPGAEQTLADIQENIGSYASFGKESYPILADLRTMKSITREGRQYAASEEAGHHITAVAMLIKSPLSKMIGNFWMRTSQPRYPTRLFTSEKEALKWLKSFLD